MKIPFENAKRKLARLWFIASALIITCGIIAFFLSSEKSEEVTSTYPWLINYLGPTLTLIVTIIAFDIHAGNTALNRKVDRFFFRVSYYFSLVYLTIIFIVYSLTALVQIVPELYNYLGAVPKLESTVIERLDSLKVLLNFLLTLVTTAVGFFFYKRET
ncbi:hypothetical protein [Flagellimonas onchidii]|uniref:hypothetical protein n=1 Tax=Flagellimonas onchidii TaxID=2562684 RepID=UPI0010A66F97|nr:hypothetical protein [Allomuricauda onchidii]